MAQGDVVFEGSVVNVGELGEFFDGFWVMTGRIVTFSVAADVVGASDDTLKLFWPEQYSRDGYRWLAAGPDLDTVRTLEFALVFAARAGQGDATLLQVISVASDTSDGVSFNGRCSHLEPIADDVALRLGHIDALHLLRQVAVSASQGGNDLSMLDAETFAYWEREDAD